MPANRPPDIFRQSDAVTGSRIAWSPTSTDLHVNLVELGPGEDIPMHMNPALDVLVVCLSGSGTITIDDVAHDLAPETVVLVPVNAERGIVAGENGCRYLTCHRARGGIIPQVRSRS